jgi:hypothetical protein
LLPGLSPGRPWYHFGTDCYVLCVQNVHGRERCGRGGRPRTHLHEIPFGWGRKVRVQNSPPRLLGSPPRGHVLQVRRPRPHGSAWDTALWQRLGYGGLVGLLLQGAAQREAVKPPMRCISSDHTGDAGRMILLSSRAPHDLAVGSRDRRKVQRQAGAPRGWSARLSAMSQPHGSAPRPRLITRRRDT